MKIRWLLLLIALIWAAAALWLLRKPVANWIHRSTDSIELSEKPQPDPQTYATLVAELERWRTELAQLHTHAQSPAEKSAIERDARIILEHTLPAMMRCWLGTPYDFNGTARKPGGGKIACGYFVATVLKDAGFKLNRYRLAQQPSQNILRSFLAKPDCHLTVGQPYPDFVKSVSASDRGILLVGLDTHVAFIVATGNGTFHCIHSSGSRPWCVVEEPPQHAGVLRQSNWRMLGNLTADPKVIRNWLNGTTITVRTSLSSD
ncbi:MAG: hypothetical protein Q7R22_005200 [Verrucomicrobiota bacterium JB025]|nr:hypothetical protein [Verrucomicrobiota bacterium JB025]